MHGADDEPGNLDHILPTKAIIAGPLLAVLGGDCVLNSTIFTLTSALAKEYVQRYDLKQRIKKSTLIPEQRFILLLR